jgi:predicted secreted acid phosphatase
MKIGLVVALLALLAVVPLAAATDPTSKSPQEIRDYRESGDWNRDIVKQVKRAKAWLRQRTQAERAPKKPALVLDIDETALDNYPCYERNGGIPFEGGVNGACIVEYKAPAIKPVRSLFKLARELKVAVFFITGRPEQIRAGTLDNLRRAGYTGKYELHMRPADYDKESAVPAKRASRRAIQKRGFKIIANVGDQRSDLQGGYSERTYKLPNLIYLTL